MSHRGKIARLPLEIREELNRRLDDGEPGSSLVRWLNELPAVQEILARYFSGRGINEPNLCAWRTGGFAERRLREDVLADAEDLAGDAKDLTGAAEGRLSDHLGTVLAARYAAVLAGWRGEPDEALVRNLRVLHGLSRHISKLRRHDHDQAWAEIEQARLAGRNARAAKRAADAETPPNSAGPVNVN